MAASMANSDVFSMPSNAFLDRAELESKLASSFAGRYACDGGVLSEPIAMANLFKSFAEMDSAGSAIMQFFSQHAIHSARFRHFCVSVGQVTSFTAALTRQDCLSI